MSDCVGTFLRRTMSPFAVTAVAVSCRHHSPPISLANWSLGVFPSLRWWVFTQALCRFLLLMSFCFYNIRFSVDWASGCFHCRPCLGSYPYLQAFQEGLAAFFKFLFSEYRFFVEGDYSSSLSSKNPFFPGVNHFFLSSGLDCCIHN